MKIHRANQQVIEKSFKKSFVTAILGPRRVGKTYFVTAYARRHPEACWVLLNLDKITDRTTIEQGNLESLIIEQAKYHIGEGEKIWVAIDEAQKCPEVFNQIKVLYDEYKDTDHIKFILTGSAVLSLHQLSAETLAGRIELYHLYEFTLRETVAIEHDLELNTSVFDCIMHDHDLETLSELIHQARPFKPILENELINHLCWGGFPETFSMQESEDKIIYLQNYLQTYLEKDVRAIESISNLNLYKNMMDHAAETTGSIRNDQRIIESLGCTRDTLKKYRGLLEATLLYQDVYPYINSTLKRLVKNPKTYLLSNGLISVLTGLTDLNVLQRSGLIGHRLENWFLNELKTYCVRSPMQPDINFWRTMTGVEVDFILIKKPTVYPFEVTFSIKKESKKIKNLMNFMQDEKKAPWAYYIYQGEFEIDADRRIIYLPCWVIG
jgi:uncharacterized protein